MSTEGMLARPRLRAGPAPAREGEAPAEPTPGRGSPYRSERSRQGATGGETGPRSARREPRPPIPQPSAGHPERARSDAGAILERNFCRCFLPYVPFSPTHVSLHCVATPAEPVTCRGTMAYRGGEEGFPAGLGRPGFSYERRSEATKDPVGSPPSWPPRRRTLLFDNSESGRAGPAAGRGREDSIASPPGPTGGRRCLALLPEPVRPLRETPLPSAPSLSLELEELAVAGGEGE